SRLGETEMQRLIGLLRERAIDGDEIAWPRHFAGNDDLILAQAALERELRRLERREHHAFVDDFLGAESELAVGVLLHPRHDELLIERPAVHADGDRLAVVEGALPDRRELLVAASAGADVARIDPVLVERPRGVRESRQ